MISYILCRIGLLTVSEISSSVIVTIDISVISALFHKFYIIFTRQQTDVIYLRYTWSKELHDPQASTHHRLRQGLNSK